MLLVYMGISCLFSESVVLNGVSEFLLVQALLIFRVSTWRAWPCDAFRDACLWFVPVAWLLLDLSQMWCWSVEMCLSGSWLL